MTRSKLSTTRPRTLQRHSDILICIPVFNEARHVAGVLEKVKSFHPDVLVVDDGSTDGTGELLDSQLAERFDVRVLRHHGNRGYGQSLIDGFAYAAQHGFKWVVTMDCDEQHEPEMIPAFLDLIAEDKWDVISGSRYKTPREDDDSAPLDRAAINRVLTRVINSVYGLGLTDSFCGFKAHRVSSMQALALTEPGYAFPMQFWPALIKHQLSMTEMSVRRIYVDPKRSFGGNLDQPLIRLTHYLEVLATQHARLFDEHLDWPTAQSLLDGSAIMPTRPPTDSPEPAPQSDAALQPNSAHQPEVCCGCHCD